MDLTSSSLAGSSESLAYSVAMSLALRCIVPFRSFAITHIFQLVNLLDGLLDDLVVEVVSNSLIDGWPLISGFASDTIRLFLQTNYLIVDSLGVGDNLIGSDLERIWKVIHRNEPPKDG